MEFWKIIVILVVVLPVAGYLTMKFGAAGYFRAKSRQQKKEKYGKEE